jgi:hypothetical protein
MKIRQDFQYPRYYLGLSQGSISEYTKIMYEIYKYTSVIDLVNRYTERFNIVQSYESSGL